MLLVGKKSYSCRGGPGGKDAESRSAPLESRIKRYYRREKEGQGTRVYLCDLTGSEEEKKDSPDDAELTR